jgi:hypothetical protein
MAVPTEQFEHVVLASSVDCGAVSFRSVRIGPVLGEARFAEFSTPSKLGDAPVDQVDADIALLISTSVFGGLQSSVFEPSARLAF